MIILIQINGIIEEEMFGRVRLVHFGVQRTLCPVQHELALRQLFFDDKLRLNGGKYVDHWIMTIYDHAEIPYTDDGTT